MNKPKIYFAIGLTFLLLCSVSASYYIYSNILPVTVGDYSLTLSETHDGLQINLAAKLIDPDANPVNNAQIEFYNCSDISGTQSTWTKTAFTNSSGIATVTYTAPNEGTYYFRARYLV